jgi:hypothetical protein
MHTSTDFRQDVVFVAGGAELKRFDGQLRSLSLAPRYEISCADGLRRTFDNMDSLLDFENPPRKAIQALIISASDMRSEVRFRLRLENSFASNVSASIEGDEEAVIDLKDALDNLLSATRPGYYLFARANYYWLVFAVFFIINFGALFWLLWHADSFSIPAPSAPRQIVLAFLRGGAVGLIPWFFSILLNRTRDRVFPTGVFLIGQGEIRHRRMDYVRTVIIAGVLVSILGSLVVAALMSSR